MSGDKDKRVRLSLECTQSIKDAIERHGTDLGQWSFVGSIRRAVARSKQIYDLEQRGTLMLVRHSDGELEDVELG